MEFEKGQLINMPITSDNGETKSLYFLVQSVDTLFPVMSAYSITPIEEQGTRMFRSSTNVPLVPSSDNNLIEPSVIKMNQEFILDRRKSGHIIGQLNEDEQQIVDLYEKQYIIADMIERIDVESLDKDMQCPYLLFNAIKTDDDINVIRLLNDGVRVDEAQLGVTPLHFAAQHGAILSARILLDHGAYVEALDAEKRTPLYYAVGNNNYAMSKTLLGAGANPDLRIGNNKIREIPCSKELGQMLESYSPDLNSKNGLSLGRK